MPDLDQRRAAFAWRRVEDAKRSLSNHYESYRNLAKGAPALVMNNGLMQTLAFFRSKDKPHHRALLGDILAWLHEEDCAVPVPLNYGDAMKFLHSEAASAQYRLATEETMHLLRWLRQFADS